MHSHEHRQEEGRAHHRHHPPHEHHSHEHRPPHRGRGGRGHGDVPGGRARRGEARYILLDALRDAPRHGYEIIKALEERSSGQYTPSPGTVYPTLQYLEELGLVRADQESERRVYHLTEAGQHELTVHSMEIETFWNRLERPAASAACHLERGFLQEEMENLERTVWGGLREALGRSDQETIRFMRQAVERCRQEIRSLLTECAEETREAAVETGESRA